jgi:hypothetical protein
MSSSKVPGPRLAQTEQVTVSHVRLRSCTWRVLGIKDTGSCGSAWLREKGKSRLGYCNGSKQEQQYSSHS